MSETIKVRFLRDYADWRKGDVDNLPPASYDRLMVEGVITAFVAIDVPQNKRVKPTNVDRKGGLEP